MAAATGMKRGLSGVSAQMRGVRVGTPVRDARVDALRFFAMALVVLTHVLGLRHEFKALAPWLVDSMVAFNMPLFAVLSGYVLLGREGHGAATFLKGKALGLLVPYAAWILVELPIRKYAPSEWLPRVAHAMFDPHMGLQMWFLWVLFVLFVIFSGSRAISHSDAFTAGFALVFGVAGAAALGVGVPEVLGLDKLAWLYPFLILGYLLAKHRERLRRFDGAVAFVALVTFPVLLWAGPVSGVASLLGWALQALLKVATALSGIAALWALYKAMPKVALDWQGAVGKRTLGLYGWQMVTLPFLIVGTGWWGAAMSWSAVMIVSTLLTLMLERAAVTRAVFLGQWPKKSPAGS